MGRVTTAFVVLLYLAVFLSVFISDQLPSVPSEDVQQKEFGLNLSEAFADLHHIARRPHPYLSHENDRVREYILGRVVDIQKQAAEVDVEVSDDQFSTVKWGTNTLQGVATGLYFEGTNILAKIRGFADDSDGEGAVLFSAHYDSVSTASGAVDDGMGIVTLLQLLSYFTTHPPRRTVLFNFNNGEEDGLNGAHAFLLHPWIANPNASLPASEIPKTFLNLEGASSGGRPLLFRATGGSVLGAFAKGRVPHPHANVLSADAFARGLVRSGTDYSVYNQPCAVPSYSGSPENKGCQPMDGIDLAFYRGRSKYHTKYDAIPYIDGSQRSLWAMMETTLSAGRSLANDNVDVTGGVGKDQNSIYFDLFGVSFLIFPMSYLLTFNIIALVAGPIILILVSFTEAAVVRSRRSKAQLQVPSVVVTSPTTVEEEEADSVTQPLQSSRTSTWRNRLPGPYTVLEHLQFWIALVLVIGVQVAIVTSYLILNPLIVYTYPFLVLLSNLSFAIVVFTAVPSLFALHPSWTPASQTRTLLLHSYIFTYVLLIFATIGINRLGVGSGYFISIWNVLVWLGCLGITVGGCIFGGKDTVILVKPSVDENDNTNSAEPDHDHDDSNERTPLIRRRSQSRESSQSVIKSSFSNILTYLPSLVLAVLLVPAPLILISHISVILLGSLPQTLADGSPAITVYGALALLSVLGGVVVLPFTGLTEGELVESKTSITTGAGLTLTSHESNQKSRFDFGAFIIVLVGLFGTGILLATWVPWPTEWLPTSRYTEGWQGGVFPFNEGSPLKVFFQQKVLISGSGDGASLHNAGAKIKVTTIVTGLTPFIDQMVLPVLPSYREANASSKECVWLGGAEAKKGLQQCSWVVWESAQVGDDEMIPYPGGLVLNAGSDIDQEQQQNHSSHDTSANWPWQYDWQIPSNKWMSARAQKMFNLSDSDKPGAQFRIRGQNTRGCRVYFDSPVKAFRVLPEGKDWVTVNTTEIRLWSRTWGREFVLEVVWDDKTDGDDQDVKEEEELQTPFAVGKNEDTSSEESRTGRVACEWAEYESGMVGMPSDFQRTQSAKIPAYEEVLTFLPRWAVASKLADGLVEVESRFVL